MKTRIASTDLLSNDQYILVRAERRRAIVAHKKLRRIAIGPHATVHFEDYETMLFQIQEMLYIEKGGTEQIADELAAYNPMIPQGHDLAATILFEIDEPQHRTAFLSTIGGIENNFFIRFGEKSLRARAETDVVRTNDRGKASAVHFIHIDFDGANRQQFCDLQTQITIGFDHPSYSHMAMLPEAMHAALITDFG